MSYAVPSNPDEKRWQAESDAHTLAEATRIQEDKARMEAATTAAKRMADEEAERTAAMRKVANRKRDTGVKKHTGRKSTTPRTSVKMKQVRKSNTTKNKFNVFERI